jgi:hypothetical protein
VKGIISDSRLVAYCGLYCGACGKYLKGKCEGCHENLKAGWCKIRSCCIDNQYASCAECKEFTDPNDCRKFNNFISKIIGFVLRSNRAACIAQIKEIGIEGHANKLTELKRSSIKR